MSNIDVFGGAYKGSTVLVTGDTGFKGSWLAIWLQKLGAHVHGFSLPPKGINDNFCQCGLAQLVSHQDGDIRDLKSLRDFFRLVKPDFAFHLAAQSLVLTSYADPLDTFSTNIMGTANFLECVRESASLKAAIVVTSDKCYRNEGQDRAFIEDDPLGGKDPYSASKAACEIITSSWIESFGLSSGGQALATARAGNVIGGGDWCDNRLVPDLFRALQTNEPISIRNPHSVRPWQHVLEAVGGYLLLCARLARNRGLQGAWNFGPMPENCVSDQHLIQALVTHLKAGEARIEPDHTNREASTLKLHTDKARSLLGWAPVLDFESTVRFTAEGYQTMNSDHLTSRIQQIQDYVDILRSSVPNWGHASVEHG